MTQRLLITVEEMCTLLSISRATAFRLLHEGVIPSLKIGSSRRVPVVGIAAYLKQQLEISAAETGGQHESNVDIP